MRPAGYNQVSESSPTDNGLVDSNNRRINYLRLSVTDRCNLRCHYCMPATGIELRPRSELLSWEELVRLTGLTLETGIEKLRITGGEPFIRKGLPDFLRTIQDLSGLQSIHITTNGVNTTPFVPQLQEIGIAGVNLSLDTLDRERFEQITGIDALDSVLTTLRVLLEHSIPVKINTVVMDRINTDEISAIAGLAEEFPVEVRFIEKMSLPGAVGSRPPAWDYNRVLDRLRSCYGELFSIPRNGSTALCFNVPGFTGRIGVIAGSSRSFCNGCSRIRITASGQLKTCLYGPSVLDLKEMLRNGADDGEIRIAIANHVRGRSADGFAAEETFRYPVVESMAATGG